MPADERNELPLTPAWMPDDVDRPTLSSDVSREAGANGIDGAPARSSGVELVEAGIDAFAVRKALLEEAERTIDIQYYIWRDDLTGALLLGYVRDAAKRGVRIRLLVDDNGISGLDETLRWMADLQGIEVRVFNPFRTRWFKPLDFLFRFGRANRRMHSKNFTVDGAITLIGGRNVGDEYFAAKEEGVFADLDAICVGPVVDEIAISFEAFWDCAHAVPVEDLSDPLSPGEAEAIEHALRERCESEEAFAYEREVADAPILERMDKGGIDFAWNPVRLACDPPDKISNRRPDDETLLGKFADLIGEPRNGLLVVSGYFVPTEQGVRGLSQMAQDGLDVRILTNSYAATDVGLVHAGYSRHRETLIEAGVQLFEVPGPHDRPKRKTKLAGGLPRKKAGHVGPSLHAKVFCVDKQRVYIGSLNLDPRSFWLNTELGIVIDSPEMAHSMQERFETAIARNTYRLAVRGGRLGWIDERDDEPQFERPEPGTSLWSRAVVAIFGRLGIDWLL